MSALTDLSIAEALKGLKNKDFTAVELAQAHIDAGDAAQALNAYITRTSEHALTQAKASDAKYASGDEGALEGIPLAVKDMFCTKDVRTTASSKILEHFVPPYESTCTQKLWNDGAVMLGKVALDEFAMGASNTTSAYGNVINPWRADDGKDRVPGGSSGGSSAAVSARIAMGATGTDTNGSIRQPASFTGICGIKPTYGRCSRWGIIAFASSLDQAGAMARSVEDCALLLQSMSGHDPKDSTSANKDVPDWAGLLNADLKGKTIGIPQEFRVEGMSDEIETMWQNGRKWLEDAGANVIDISLPHAKYAVPAYYLVAPAEASSNLARYDGVKYGHRTDDGETLKDMYTKSRAEGFGDEVKRRIMIGTYALSAGYYDAYYIKAQKIRRLISDDFKAAFEQCDAILTPTSPSAAFPIGERNEDPVQMYMEDIFTSPASMAGLPAMSVPAGLNSEGLPLGLQIMGRPWDEEMVLNTALAVEKAAQFSAIPQTLKNKAA